MKMGKNATRIGVQNWNNSWDWNELKKKIELNEKNAKKDSINKIKNEVMWCPK